MVYSILNDTDVLEAKKIVFAILLNYVFEFFFDVLNRRFCKPDYFISVNVIPKSFLLRSYDFS